MKTPKPKMQRYTVKHFQKDFPDDDTCLEWLKNHLYPNGIHCEICQEVTKHYRVQSRKSYSCEFCGNHVHPMKGTIFEKSSTSLQSWFQAIYLMSSTRCGISAKQLERSIGVTYKTAWRMFRQIRSMLQEEVGPFSGHVEVDETYHGGRTKGGKRGRGAPNKTPVVGAVERGGKVVAKVVTDVKAATLMPFIKEKVLPKATVYTDELMSYNTVAYSGYSHRRIHHAEKVYVMGDVHTNTIEGYWSLIKRGISGVYHAVGQPYLQSYLNEYSFRYNRREDITPMFWSFLRQV